jgi:hypothetical protein
LDDVPSRGILETERGILESILCGFCSNQPGFVWVQIVNLRKNVEKHGALGFNYFTYGITTLSGYNHSSKKEVVK